MSAGHRHSLGHEHDFEVSPGLPEPLPAAEKMLWQGSPDWKSTAIHAFHVRKLAVYFAIILVVRAATELSYGGSIGDALMSATWLLPLALSALAMITYFAYLSARTAVYTITDRRVVMRVGIVLTLTFNLPYARIASASLRQYTDGSGDIPLALLGNDKIAYVHLWPHAKPWKLGQPEPALRCVPEAEKVAKILSQAWSAHLGRSSAAGAAATSAATSSATSNSRISQDMSAA
jgi:hypothetical protein